MRKRITRRATVITDIIMKIKTVIIVFILLIPLYAYAYEYKPLTPITDAAINNFIEQTGDFNLIIIKNASEYRNEFIKNKQSDTDILIFKIINEYSQHISDATLSLTYINVMFQYLNDNYLDNVQYKGAFDSYLDVCIRIRDELRSIRKTTNNVLIGKYCNDLYLLIDSRISQCNKTISF